MRHSWNWIGWALIIIILISGYALYKRLVVEKIPILQSKKTEAKAKIVKKPKNTVIKQKLIPTGKNKAKLVTTLVPDPMKYQLLDMEEDPEITWETELLFPKIVITTSVGIYKSPRAMWVGFGQRLTNMPFTEIYMNTLFLFGRASRDKACTGLGVGLSYEVMPHLSVVLGGLYSTLNTPELMIGASYGW